MTIVQKLFHYVFISLRRSVYLSLGLSRFLPWHKERGVAVFCYHSVANDNWRFSINYEDLQKHILHLLKVRKPITVEDLLLHIRGEKIITLPSFMVMFDDGYKDILITKDFFKENGVHPVVAVFADTANVVRSELDTERPLLTFGEMTELQNSGWDIACHSATHRNFSALTPVECHREIIEARAILEKELGFPVKYFVYPKGKYTPTILEFVSKAGYEMAFSMNAGFVQQHDDTRTVSRIGVDRTHVFSEFKTLTTPTTLALRRVVKHFINSDIAQAPADSSVEEYYKKKFLSQNSLASANAVVVRSLPELEKIADNSVESIIIDELLTQIPDYSSVIRHAHRALRPNGTVLSAVSSIVPASKDRLWGFTATSSGYIFGKFFKPEHIELTNYGNALAGRLLLSGAGVAGTSAKKLDNEDPFFPVIIGVKAVKK